MHSLLLIKSLKILPVPFGHGIALSFATTGASRGFLRSPSFIHRRTCVSCAHMALARFKSIFRPASQVPLESLRQDFNNTARLT